MEIKKFWILLGILVAVLVPWYFMKYQKLSTVIEQERCDAEFGLIKVDSDPHKLSVCNLEEFDRLLVLLEHHVTELKFVHLLPEAEQYKIYKKLLREYVVIPYLVREFLKEKHIIDDYDFIKNKELYLRIMENNFNINAFQDYIAKDIFITDQEAKEYYLSNQKTRFNIFPFVKEVGGISAKLVAVVNEKKSLSEYELLFNEKNNEKNEVFVVEGFFPENDDPGINKQLKIALVDMKVGEIRTISLDNRNFVIKKTANRQGIWNDFEAVKEKVKFILKKDRADEVSNKIILDLEEKCKVEICDKGLTEYYKNKIVDAKEVRKVDAIKNEKIDEKEIKTVIQESVKIV